MPLHCVHHVDFMGSACGVANRVGGTIYTKGGQMISSTYRGLTLVSLTAKFYRWALERMSNGSFILMNSLACSCSPKV